MSSTLAMDLMLVKSEALAGRYDDETVTPCDDSASISASSDIIDDENLFELPSERTRKLSFPVGCPVWYNRRSKSGSKIDTYSSGVIFSVLMDIMSGNKYYRIQNTTKVNNSSSSDGCSSVGDTVLVQEGKIAYAARCLVLVQMAGDTEVEGEIICPRSEMKTYTVMFVKDEEVVVEDGIKSHRIKYRNAQIVVGGDPQKVHQTDEVQVNNNQAVAQAQKQVQVNDRTQVVVIETTDKEASHTAGLTNEGDKSHANSKQTDVSPSESIKVGFAEGDHVFVQQRKTSHPAVIVSTQGNMAKVKWSTTNTLEDVELRHVSPMHTSDGRESRRRNNKQQSDRPSLSNSSKVVNIATDKKTDSSDNSTALAGSTNSSNTPDKDYERWKIPRKRPPSPDSLHGIRRGEPKSFSSSIVPNSNAKRQKSGRATKELCEMPYGCTTLFMGNISNRTSHTNVKRLKSGPRRQLTTELREMPYDCTTLFMGNISNDVDKNIIRSFFLSVGVEIKELRHRCHQDGNPQP